MVICAYISCCWCAYRRCRDLASTVVAVWRAAPLLPSVTRVVRALPGRLASRRHEGLCHLRQLLPLLLAWVLVLLDIFIIIGGAVVRFNWRDARGRASGLVIGSPLVVFHGVSLGLHCVEAHLRRRQIPCWEPRPIGLHRHHHRTR